jgi:CubicO group peptidase (beta-lactamase class C family)
MPVVDPFPADNFVVDLIDDWIISQMRRGQVPGMSLAITRNGKLVYAKGFGYSDIGSLRPADPTDLFRVASVSKMIAKAAIIRMQQDALHVSLSNQPFDIDLHPFGDIFEYDVPAHSPNLGDITIRDLLNHKPGVVRADFGGLFTPEQWIEKEQEKGAASFAYCPASFTGGGCAPATEEYANGNYYVLSEVFPAVSGLQYKDYLRQTMLDPLNLNRIQVSEPTFGIPPAECPAGQAPPALPAGLFQAVHVSRPEFYRDFGDATYRGHEWLCPKDQYTSAAMAGSSIDILRYAVAVNQQRMQGRLLDAASWVDMAATGVGRGVNKGGLFPELSRAIVTQLTPDDNSGDIVYSWAMNSEDAGSFGMAELDDILRGVGPQLPDRDLFDDFIEPPVGVLSLDSADGWTIVSGTGTLTTSSVHTEGSGAIRVAGGGFIETRSPPVSTDEIAAQTGGATPARIGLEVFIPTNQPNPYWIGLIQFYVEIPSVGYGHNYIGQVQLTGLPRGRFVHIETSIPAAQRTLLAGSHSDVRLYIAVNTPTNAPPVIVDHLQFRP